MLYQEYLKCAFKHLKGCEQLLGSYTEGKIDDTRVFLELYYLSGYIIEALTVYSVYKLYGWPSGEDIRRRYNLSFTNTTGLDYYYERRIGGRTIFPTRPLFSIQGHRFQPIVQSLLKTDPSFNDVPYLGAGDIDPDIEQLIDKWDPGVRYYYEGGPNSFPTLNTEILIRLINTCNTIYINHI